MGLIISSWGVDHNHSQHPQRVSRRDWEWWRPRQSERFEMGRGRGTTETRKALNRLKRKHYRPVLHRQHIAGSTGDIFTTRIWAFFYIVNFTFPEIPTNTILTGSKWWDTDKIFSHHFQKKLKFFSKAAIEAKEATGRHVNWSIGKTTKLILRVATLHCIAHSKLNSRKL